MPLPPIPVERYLTPDAAASAPEGFNLVDEAVLDGLPHVVTLTPSVQLQIVMPHGVAAMWTDADPGAVVSRSDEERAPYRPSATPPGAVTHPPLRLVLRIDNGVAGSAPLVAGKRFFLPEAGAGVRYEFFVINWTILAGTVKGPGAHGSKVTLAWREAQRAIDQFSTPPVSFKVVERLPEKDRMQSQLGLRVAHRLVRFAVKRVVLR